MGDSYNYETLQYSDDLFRRWRDLFRAGDEAPDFTGRTLDGGTVRLSDFRGKAHVLLEFGAIT
ncbi:MAG: redoxin domain-containing protein [Chloroflexi bacterium]|nr:redoxin domain-containing protein [Chloroflexota bacterium]